MPAGIPYMVVMMVIVLRQTKVRMAEVTKERNDE